MNLLCWFPGDYHFKEKSTRMGRKGKMSDHSSRYEGAGKWSKNEELRNLYGSINYARKTAYDHQLIEQKKNELSLLSRKKLIFPHLSSLINQRVRADDLELLTQTAQKDWTNHLRAGLPEKMNDEMKIRLAKAKKKLYRTLYREYIGSSLSRICVQAIAKNVSHYSVEDVKFALSTVDYSYTDLLSLLSALYGTLRDDMVTGLTHELSERVFFSKNISDLGISAYFSTMHNSSKDHFSALESWEQIELSEINITSCMCLREITVLSSRVTSSAIRVIEESCRSLEKFRLHDVQFGKEADTVDPTVFCLQLCDIFTEGFPNLVTLEILQCGWVRWDGIKLWATNIFTRRQRGCPTLPKLTYLTLPDVQERGMRSADIRAEGRTLTSNAVTPITQLIDYFSVNCFIELTIDSH